jgi:hypothetical protein
MTKKQIIEMSKKKASQSICGFKICAIALNHKDEVIGKSMNRPGFKNYTGCGVHAERVLMKKFGNKIKTIFIIRVSGHNLNLRPIHPCKTCEEIANKLGIKIISLS